MTEETYMESEEEYKDFCDNANDLMQSITPESRFRYVNNVWLKTLGYKKQEVANMTIINIIHPDELDHCQELFMRVMSGENVGLVNTTFVTKGGNKVFVEGNVSCKIVDDKPVYTRAVFRDITERKHTEEAQRRREVILSESQRIGHIGSWELDIVSNTLTWSDEVYQLFELEPQQFEATYEAFLDNIHPDDREMVDEAYAESVRNKTPYDIVHRLLLKDGTIKYVNERCETFFDENGKPIRMVGCIRDITERKQMEQVLEESERNFRNSVDSSPLGVTIGSSEGELLYVNKAMLDIGGYSSIQELITVPEEQRYTPETYAEYRKRIQLGESTPASFEMGIVRKDGVVRHLSVFRREVIWDGEKRFQSLYQDITDRMRLEEQKKLLIKELQESLANVKTLSGLLPMCAWCRKLRDDEGYWSNLEQYITTHTLAEFTHGICPECRTKFFPDDK